MMPWSAGTWCARIASAALLALVVVAPGCGRLPDETWLRVLWFEQNNTVTSSVTSIVRKITDTTTKLQSTDYVVAVFANQSAIVSRDLAAGGVTVDRVRITYAIPGYSPPEASYAVTLYVPAGTSTSTDTTPTNATTGTTTNARLTIALVSTDLKNWLSDTIDESVLAGGLHASARLVFHAVTDQGGELETEAGIGIVFENETPATEL